MNKICTSQEQSKKLVELGIDIHTADIIYNILDESYIRHNTPIDKFHTPAWSLTALMKLIPFQIITKNERYGFRQWKGYNTQGETYCFEYISSTNQRLYETYHWNNPLDAAFEMVCWLKKEEYI